MDPATEPDRTQKPWDHPWTTDEMREKRAEWNLAGDSGLLQHLQQFADKLTSTANKTQEALNSLSSELDETIIFIDNITNTSLALANTQFIESRVRDDDAEDEPPQEQHLEAPKTKEQLDAELIASIGETVRRGIAIMEEKYEALEVIASDSEDEGEIPIPSIILRSKDPYQDRPLPYVIGSEKWINSNKIGLETSSSDSEQQEDDDSESDAEDNRVLVSNPINLHNPRIARLSSSSSESDDFSITNDITRPSVDRRSNKTEDIFDSESETTTAANSLPKNSSNAAPNFAEELAKRLSSVNPTQKSLNTQVTSEPVIKPKDDLFTPEEEDLFGAPSKNLFNEPESLFDDKTPNSLWHDKPSKPFKSSHLPPPLDGPPPMNNISTKPKLAIDDLFGDADSEDSDDIFSGKTSIGKPLNQNNSPSSSLRTEDRKKTNNLLSAGGLIVNEGIMTSTPETNDIANSLFNDDSEDVENLFSDPKKHNDWSGAKASVPDKSAGSTPAEASDTHNRKKPVGGVSILGQIDIFASGKLRRRVSSDSSSSKSDQTSDFDTSPSRIVTNTRYGVNSVTNNNSADGNSGLVAPDTGSRESSGISLQPPSIDNITAGSTISPDFQPQMTSTWNKTGDMYRERIVSDSLFAAKTLDRDDESSLNNAHIDEALAQPDRDLFSETDDIFGPPPLPKAGSKTGPKSKIPSLFDDSDSGDDLFSNTSSGSRSQRSTDLLTSATTTTTSTATSQSLQEKSKVHRTKGLFDDDDDDDDEDTNNIFGSKDSPGLNLFAPRTSVKSKQPNVVEETSRSSVKGEKSVEVKSTVKQSFGSGLEKQDAVQVPQVTKSIAKQGSIFDDLDDDDLFSPSYKKTSLTGQNKKVMPSLFDNDADDLFAIPAAKTATPGKLEKTVASTPPKASQDSSVPASKSAVKIEVESKSKIMEELAAKLEVVKTEEKKDVDAKSPSQSTVGKKIQPAKNVVANKTEKPDLFSKNKSKDLASKILGEIKSVQKSKETVSKPGIAKKPEVLKKLEPKLKVIDKSVPGRDSHSSTVTEPRSENRAKETKVVSEESTETIMESEQNISTVVEERSLRTSRTENEQMEQETVAKSEKSEETLTTGRREPPKTLEIRSTTTSAATSEKSSVVQRRVVSGKIKNLMGRMSDLKILSPTDTPPVLRKNEERGLEEGDKDSEDGSSFSTSKESPTLSEELPKLVAPPSPTDSKELEPAISFDQPVQVETLSVTASKSRVRIQSKRRPQSRHARQNALRKSGIDFDTVDFANDDNSETNRNLSSNSANNNLTATENSANALNVANSNTERLVISTGGSESISVKVTESSSSTLLDDRSEISFSKESSLSINKNTLLSPSTDEEDLFDVPPDLPEDPPKEDALFGRAPILSPVESFVKVQKSYKSEKRKEGVDKEVNVSTSQSKTMSTLVTNQTSHTKKRRDVPKKKVSARDEEVGATSITNQNKFEEKQSDDEDKTSNAESEVGKSVHKSEDRATLGLRNKTKNPVISKEEGDEELIDPLRDSSHDPLKDPSNLFAFVTKTPSPEKGKNLLFNADDDSLFSSSSAKKSADGKVDGAEKSTESLPSNKKTLDLFDDNAEVNFFAASLPKPARKSQKESKIDLFGDDDDNQDDDLFGSLTQKTTAKSEVKAVERVTTEEVSSEIDLSSKKHSLFDEASEEKLFGSPKSTAAKAKSENRKVTSSSGIFSDDDSSEIFSGAKKVAKDIFADESNVEEDMFTTKKTVIKKSTVSSGLFGDDDDNDDSGDIFGKSTTASVGQSKSIETRGVVRKAATRDLRRTAEQIVEDPLSMLQKD